MLANKILASLDEMERILTRLIFFPKSLHKLRGKVNKPGQRRGRMTQNAKLRINHAKLRINLRKLVL
jgi:hypothetical protein